VPAAQLEAALDAVCRALGPLVAADA